MKLEILTEEDVRAIVRAEITASLRAQRPHSQRDLPAGCSKVKYLRTWRRARDAGDEGAWSEGRARLMTAASWSKWARVADLPPAPPAPTVRDQLLAKLGAKWA